jgi:hypothetical protein
MQFPPRLFVPRALRLILLSVGLLLRMTATASAAATYSADLTNAAAHSGPSPVFLSSSQDQSGGGHGEGNVSSGSVLTASIQTSKAASGFNNGLFTDYAGNLTASHDDIMITGPPAASIPLTLHVPFYATFTQSWDSLTLTDAGFTDFSSLGQSTSFRAVLSASSFGFSTGQFDLGLNNQANLADVRIQQSSHGIPTPAAIVAGPSPGPSSSETIGGITIFRNVPLDPNGFLYLYRTQTPTTADPNLVGPGAGFHFDDVVTLRGEMLLPGNAQVGVPLTLDLASSARSTALGGFVLDSSGGINALHNFGVPQGGAFFDLPAGYTANSASLGLVNNTVTTLAGNLTIKNDPSVTTISLGSLTTVSGSVDLSDNTAATVVSLGSLTTVGGSVNISDNGSANVNIGSLTSVGGSATIDTTGTGVFGIGIGTVAGSLDLTTTGYTEVDAKTAAGQTGVTMIHGAAKMEMAVPEGAFPTGDHVPFSVKELPADPVDSWGESPTTTLAKYQFDFAITTLNKDATLNFDLDLTALDPDAHAALLDLLHASTPLTLAVQGDDPGAALQLFTVCGAGADPSSGCVAVLWFDTNGAELIPYGDVDPAILRFEALAGHFSTYSVVAVTVPEPATLVMLLLGLLAMFPRRRVTVQ